MRVIFLLFLSVNLSTVLIGQGVIDTVSAISKHGSHTDQIQLFTDYYDRLESKGQLDSTGQVSYFLASRYYKTQGYTESITHALQAIETFERVGYNEYRKSNCYLFILRSLIALNRYEEATEYMPDIERLSQNSIENIKAFYLCLVEVSNAYDLNRDVSGAITVLNRYRSSKEFDKLDVYTQDNVFVELHKHLRKRDGESGTTMVLRDTILARYDRFGMIGDKYNFLLDEHLYLYQNKQYDDLLKSSVKVNYELKQIEKIDPRTRYGHQNWLYLAYYHLDRYPEALNQILVMENDTMAVFHNYPLLRSIFSQNKATILGKTGQVDKAESMFTYSFDLLGWNMNKGVSSIPIKTFNSLEVLDLMYDYYVFTDENRSSNESTIRIKLDSLIDLVLSDISNENSLLSLKSYVTDDYYKLICRSSYRYNDKTAFWALAEKSKGLLLLESNRNRSYTDLILAKEYHHQLDSLDREIRTLEYDKSRAGPLFKDENYLASLHYERIKIKEGLHDMEVTNPMNIIQPEEVSIGGDEMIIQYKYGQEHLYAMTIKSNGANELIQLSPIEEVDSLIQGYNCVSTSDCDGETAGALYNVLLEPLGPLPQELTIIPDGSLSFLPFESLMDKNGVYLIESSTVSYAISATHLWHQAQKTSINFSARLFAPDYDKSDLNDLYASLSKGGDNDFKYLAYSKEESDHLKNLMNASLIEGSVSKESLLGGLQEASVFHFTGHGFQDANDHRFSFLALTDDSDQYESIITSTEIDQAQTNADLVVLNACNTGTGELISGEGVFSLARSFFKAGAKSVVNSLWSIDDQSSSQIMIDFYTNLKKGQSKSQALRNAKLSYINTAPDHKRHPYYWAGLILIGDDSPIEMGGDSYAGTIIGISAFVILGIFLWRQWYKKTL